MRVRACFWGVLIPRSLLSQLTHLSGQLFFFQTHFVSPCLLLCLRFCDAGLKEWGLGQAWTWPVGWPAAWPLFLFLGPALSVRMLKGSVTCCDVTQSNVSFKMVLWFIFLFVGLYHVRSITVGVFIWNLIEALICHLESVFLTCFYCSWLRVVLGRVGLAIHLTSTQRIRPVTQKLMLSVLAAARD